jgi:hypothetical protein
MSVGLIVAALVVLANIAAAAADNGLVIQFQNNLDKELDIYWLNPDTKEKSFIASVAAHGVSSLNSYVVIY